MDDSDVEPLLSHQQVIARQDQGLDDLAKIIRRQREIGITIGTEVDQQNGMNSTLICILAYPLTHRKKKHS